MTAPTTETLAGLLAKANMFGNHSEALAVARLSSLAPTLAAEVIALRERVAELEGALSDMIAVAEQDSWDKSMSGRQIIIRNSRATLSQIEALTAERDNLRKLEAQHRETANSQFHSFLRAQSERDAALARVRVLEGVVGELASRDTLGGSDGELDWLITDARAALNQEAAG